ncbi:hypothetical protein KPL74_01980 [Bacillus sp. NP157]|nr:hypothetical protein KPL74_01980 [Bacillus sp. NP157]
MFRCLSGQVAALAVVVCSMVALSACGQGNPSGAHTGANTPTASSSAPTKPVSHGTTSDAVLRYLGASSPCDLVGNRTPKDFFGSDIHSIIGTIQHVGASKSEYETTAQFQQRMANAVSGAANPVQCIRVGETSFQRYDADAGVETLTVFFRQVPRTEKGEFVKVSERTASLGSYDAQNAFGAHVEVSERRTVVEGVVFDGKALDAAFRKLGAKRTPDRTTIRLKMDVDTAKALPKDLSVLLVYQWLPPFYGAETNYESPSFSSPERSQEELNYLHGRLTGVVVYSPSSGTIFASGTP